MNYFVYALEHTYTDETHTDSKFLGYFDDIEMLEKAKERALTLPGFGTYPDGLTIRKYELNKIHWQNGFNSVVGEIGRDYLNKEDVISEGSKSIKELNLQYVFQVSHTYTINTFLDDERIIGVFLDELQANDAVDNCKKKIGFKNYPDDFIVGRFTLNNFLWISGF
ncbi:hypothetical protein [Chryseobacterium jejuense]|uniref:Uncharacterized protein n=1 Tax=Chryseobacterium jejuense TaxID=445960 RepID=A0A2X2XBD4_CHRJE|nr:hypothetical protein [Chryseobacterium jejuense]SDI09181.1 hypothetical protein SAMN05421542_0037 [Chryseobacterium jejuense]SQB47513.1 Uncharacterised protein [Chryseobacterium jejuense]